MSHPRVTLDLLGAAARKSLSQNFLISPHWAERLTQSALDMDCDAFWEIGPGLGALTKLVIEKSKVPVTLFEYDRKLAEYLRETYPNTPLIEGDVLDQDLAHLADGKRLSVLSNLPYHLSSAILFALAELPKPPVQMVLTFQKEFAQRLSALPRTPSYGALSVIIQLQFEMEKLGIIPAGAFYPAPDIDSEALRFRPRGPALDRGFRLLIKGAFQQRRKLLSSNLKKALPGRHTDGALQKMGIDPNARAEELSPEQYQQLGTELGLFIAE